MAKSAESTMRLVIEQVMLLKAVDHIKGVVEGRVPVPILANMRLIAKDERLSLTAAEMDIEIF